MRVAWVPWRVLIISMEPWNVIDLALYKKLVLLNVTHVHEVIIKGSPTHHRTKNDCTYHKWIAALIAYKSMDYCMSDLQKVQLLSRKFLSHCYIFQKILGRYGNCQLYATTCPTSLPNGIRTPVCTRSWSRYDPESVSVVRPSYTTLQAWDIVVIINQPFYIPEATP